MWSWLLLLGIKCRRGHSVYLQQPKTWSRLVKTGSQTLSRLNELISYTPYLPISPLFLQLIIRSFGKSVVLCFTAVARSSKSCGVTHNSWTAVRSNPENKWRAVGDRSGEGGCVSVCVCFASTQCLAPTETQQQSMTLFVCQWLVYVGAMRFWSGRTRAFLWWYGQCRLLPSHWFAAPSAPCESDPGTSGNVFLIRIFLEPLTKAPVW